MSLRPGLRAKIVTEIDPARDKIDVGDSTVYHVKESTIILAQTDPPIPESMLLGEVVITYLRREKEGLVRYGFPAQVTEFIDYRLSLSVQVKAVVVTRTGEPAPYNIRMFYRVGPRLPQPSGHVRPREQGKCSRYFPRRRAVQL